MNDYQFKLVKIQGEFRCITAPTRREPDGPVFRELYLRRVGGELRFRIERERLVFRIELTDHRASISRWRVREPHVAKPPSRHQAPGPYFHCGDDSGVGIT